MTRDRVRLALELTCVGLAGALALRWPTGALIALFAAGSASRWSAGRSWTTGRPVEPLMVAVGVAAGLTALALGVFLADPLLTELIGRSVEWTQLTAARGQLGAALVLALLAGAQVVAAELVFRRWVLERVQAVTGVGPAIAVAGLAEAWLAGGHLGARAGAGVIGVACGLLYAGSGGRLVPSIAARLAFELGAVVLVWQRIL